MVRQLWLGYGRKLNRSYSFCLKRGHRQRAPKVPPEEGRSSNVPAGGALLKARSAAPKAQHFSGRQDLSGARLSAAGLYGLGEKTGKLLFRGNNRLESSWRQNPIFHSRSPEKSGRYAPFPCPFFGNKPFCI